MSLIGYSANAYFITTYYHWNAITTDPDDNKFFDAAIAAGADYLVTNDNHFSEAKNFSFPKVAILSAEVFLNLLLQ